MYRGYSFENTVKLEYQEIGFALKLCRAQLADLIFFDFASKKLYLIECKQRKGKWYPNKHDIKQFLRLKEMYSKLSDKERENLKIKYEIKEKGVRTKLIFEECGIKYFKKHL